MHVGILTDYPVVAFANGPSLSTQALKRNLEARGHRVTIVGPRPAPDEPAAQPGSLLLDSVDFAAHPGVQLAMPWPPKAFREHPGFDVIHSHANSLLMHWGPMMRELHGIPCVSTNTIYLPAFAQHLLPNQLYEFEALRNFWAGLSWTVERSFARVYNAGDGLIVQCKRLEEYWKKKGMKVPLHTIPRPIDVRNFDRPLGLDPYRGDFPKGFRLITVGRHAREKDIDKVLHLFARHVLPACPEASLTLVGDGLEHHALQELARTLGVLHRCDFVGETPHRDLRDWYGHGDVFVYASLSETYGQVISEALWCGVPVVALDDDMGVAYQVADGHDGTLATPGTHEIEALAAAAVRLLTDTGMRRTYGERAAARARTRVAPARVFAEYEQAYEAAIAHLAAHPRKRTRHDNPAAMWRMTWDHVVPWAWKHAGLSTLGAFRGTKGYSVPKGIPLDAAPAETPVQPSPEVAGAVAALLTLAREVEPAAAAVETAAPAVEPVALDLQPPPSARRTRGRARAG